MIWAVLLLFGVVAVVHWLEYNRAVEEYTFAQPVAAEGLTGVRTVISEKTPIVIEVGALPWRPEVVEKSAWTMTVEAGEEAQMEMPASQWLAEIPRRPLIGTGTLLDEMGFTTGLMEIADARPWWWLPDFKDTTVDIMVPGEIRGLRWVTAEREWLGCSSGGPLTVWLVHRRYRRYLPLTEVDPWTVTVADAPWIGRVQYIEVVLKPGWCIGLPAHWGYAIRCESVTPQGEAGKEAWVWNTAQHSAMSLLLS